MTNLFCICSINPNIFWIVFKKTVLDRQQELKKKKMSEKFYCVQGDWQEDMQNLEQQ